MFKKSRGLAIAITLIILPMVIVLGFGLASLGIQNLNHASASRYSKKALFAAEAGANRALIQLRKDPSYASPLQGQMTGDTSTYSVTIFNNLAGGGPITASNGAQVPPGTAYILSEGGARNDNFKRTVGVLLKVGQGGTLFPYAAFGHVGVDVQGTADTDSFNSNDGSYNSTKQNSDGNIGTNSTQAGAIGITGSSNVGGNVDVGVNGDPNAVISGGGSFNSAASLTSPFPMPPVSIPAGVSQGNQNVKKTTNLAPGTYGDVRLTGQGELILSPGVYVFNTLDVSGNTKITVNSGPVEVYIVGDGNPNTTDLDLTGTSAVNNNTGAAPNLVFYGGPDVSEVKMRGNSQAYYAVYAPAAHADLVGTSDLFGSVIANSVRLTGTPAIHFDRALLEMENAPGGVELMSWQRI